MSIKGVNGRPFINLDEHINVELFKSLFDEMAMGISKSWIDKGVVSCGTRGSEEKLELCQVLQNPNKYLNSNQIKNLNELGNLHQKAWYCSLILPVHHPYSLVFIRRERDFWKKQYSEFCDWTENAKHFPQTIEFLKALPFEQIGRILFFITEPHQETLIHYDGANEESRNRKNTEMIYFRPQKNKKLFIWDDEKKESHMLEGFATYWNDLDWHGALPTQGKSFSLRIDGVFEDSFRKKIAT